MVSDTTLNSNIPEVRLFLRFCQGQEDEPLPVGKPLWILQVFCGTPSSLSAVFILIFPNPPLAPCSNWSILWSLLIKYCQLLCGEASFSYSCAAFWSTIGTDFNELNFFLSMRRPPPSEKLAAWSRLCRFFLPVCNIFDPPLGHILTSCFFFLSMGRSPPPEKFAAWSSLRRKGE